MRDVGGFTKGLPRLVDSSVEALRLRAGLCSDIIVWLVGFKEKKKKRDEYLSCVFAGS